MNKKKFLLKLKKTMSGPFMLLSLRGDKTCIEVICWQTHFHMQILVQVFNGCFEWKFFPQVLVKMLDVDVLSNEEERLQIISTLQSSPEGQKAYEALCEKLVIFSTI